MLVRNTIANFVGQGYLILVGIIVLPMFLQFMGPEEFGMIGFFTLLNTWLQILTTGLSPTLARQVAVFQARDALHSTEFRHMLRSLEAIVLAAGLVITLAVFLAADWLQANWLNSSELDPSLIRLCIVVMGFISALRLGVMLYTSGMMGMERQVWMNGFNMASATFRFVGGLLVVLVVDDGIDTYFIYQALVSVVELLTLSMAFYGTQPRKARVNDPGLRFSIGSLRETLPFTLSVTYSAFLWLFVTQFDKILLSGVLTLEYFGYLSFVVVLANGVLRLAGPVNQAFLPRLTALVSQKQVQASERLYYDLTEFIAVLALSISFFIAVFSEQILFVLSDNEKLVVFGAEPLFWFAIGNGMMVLSSLFYTLQVAHGNLKLHVYQATISTAIQVPLMAYIALNHDVVTLGIAWFIIRFGIFFLMSLLVHHKFQSGTYLDWLGRGILLPSVGVALGTYLAIIAYQNMIGANDLASRMATFLILMPLFFMVVTCAAAGSKRIRTAFVSTFFGSAK